MRSYLMQHNTCSFPSSDTSAMLPLVAFPALGIVLEILVAAMYFFLYEIPESSLFSFPVVKYFISPFDFVYKSEYFWLHGLKQYFKNRAVLARIDVQHWGCKVCDDGP